MRKVLIVEDELLARLGLHQLIDWQSLDMVLLEDAVDGKQALQRIILERPDIVLLDLNLPQMDGLQVLNAIREKNLACQVIVITCNEDFETVKTAMKLGAFDFLRKLNLNADDLKNALQKCLELPTATARMPQAAEYPYEELVDRSKSVFDSIPIPCVSTACLIARDRADMDALAQMRLCVLKTAAFMERPVALIPSEGYALFIAAGWRISENDCLGWQKVLENALHCPIAIGYNDTPAGSNDEVLDRLTLDNQILSLLYYDVPQTIVRFEEPIRTYDRCPFDDRACNDRFHQALSLLSLPDLHRAMETLFTDILSHPYIRVNILRRQMIDLLSMFSNFARELGLGIEDVMVEGQNNHYRVLLTRNSLAQVHTYLDRFLDAFVRVCFVPFKSAKSDIMQKTFAYLREHLDQPIQLGMVAKSIGISETYLSAYFKKEIGQNFITYVNGMKMARATELLRTGMLGYEVSEQLGYENYAYFSKVFKKYTGVTPETCRKQ